MSILDAYNLLVTTINSIKCSIRNIQTYVGTTDEDSLDTLTGRIKALEVKLAACNCGGNGSSLGPDDSTEV